MTFALSLSLAVGLVFTSFAAVASGGGGGGPAGSGGPTRISEAQARANNANTLTPGSCVAFCESRGSTKSQCANTCRVNTCYHNPSTTRSYCVKAP